MCLSFDIFYLYEKGNTSNIHQDIRDEARNYSITRLWNEFYSVVSFSLSNTNNSVFSKTCFLIY